MKKRLKFASRLVPLILSGEKTATWRLWDDKDLSVGDEVEFLDKETGKRFTQVILTTVIEKPLGKLTKKDRIGHETTGTPEEMYKTFSEYYHRPVGPKTKVKIVWFDLL